MKQMKLLVGTLGVAAVLAAQTVLGAGFGIYEGSARGNAMGTEVTADPASPSVLYNNAAGMTELEGTQVEAGVTLIRPSQTVVTTTPAGENNNYAKSKWWAPPNAYVTHQVNEKVWAGMGVFSRYGLGIDYEDNWAGRYDVQEATIQSLDLNPSIAVKVMENLSLAAGGMVRVRTAQGAADGNAVRGSGSAAEPEGRQLGHRLQPRRVLQGDGLAGFRVGL